MWARGIILDVSGVKVFGEKWLVDWWWENTLSTALMILFLEEGF